MNEAISFAEKAIHLSPCDPVVGDRYFVIGQAHLLQSHIDEAIMWLERSVNARPRLPLNRGWLTAAYALKGDTQRAAAALAEARRLAGEGFFSSIARRRLEWSSGVGRGARPEIHALFETTYFAGLRKAGVPEE
jgi:predicted Zn-dependent protease